MKKTFLKGYFNADGSYRKYSWTNGKITTRVQIAASNKILVEQIRSLCIQVGYSVSNISESHRVSNFGQNDLWRFLITSFTKKRGCKSSIRSEYPLKFLPQGVNWATIRSIKEIGENETYDLEIEDVHNFICENILVANSNSHEQKRLFWEDTMLPKLMKLQEHVTAFLLPRYGSRLIGEFDLSDIQALQESEEVKSKTATSLVDSGIMTRDEARMKYYQLDTVLGGDKITIRGKYVTIEDTPSPDDEGSGEDQNPENGENTEDDGNFNFSKEELQDFVVSLRKRLKKKIKESK